MSWLEFSQHDLNDCPDTAPNQIKGWEQVLRQATLPNAELAKNVEIIYGDGPLSNAMRTSGIIERIAKDVRRFDWPNGITLHFDHCDQGAYWDKETRTIMLCDDYVNRFIKQSTILELKAKN